MKGSKSAEASLKQVPEETEQTVSDKEPDSTDSQSKTIQFPYGEHEAEDSDAVLCSGTEYPSLLPIEEAVVRCLRVLGPVDGPYEQKIIFENEVLWPHEYVGIVLRMYAKHYDRPSPLSKMMKQAVIATGQHKIRKITKKMFLGHVFRCRVRLSGEGNFAYSVIDTYLEKLDK